MFSGKQAALDHRDAVYTTITETHGQDQPLQIQPTLEGATVMLAELNPETVQETMEDAGFSVNQAGESPDGDWFKLQVKP